MAFARLPLRPTSRTPCAPTARRRRTTCSCTCGCGCSATATSPCGRCRRCSRRPRWSSSGSSCPGDAVGGSAIAATALLALNPFAIRYGAETRMYALVMLEVVVGLAAVAWSLERPRLGRLAVGHRGGRPRCCTPTTGRSTSIIAVIGGLLLAVGPAAAPPGASRWPLPPASCSGCRGCRRSASKRPTPRRRGRRRPARRPPCRCSPAASARRRSSSGSTASPWPARSSPRSRSACRGGTSRSRPPGWPPSPPAPPPSACSARSSAPARSATATSPWPSPSSSSPPASGCGGSPVAGCGWPCSAFGVVGAILAVVDLRTARTTARRGRRAARPQAQTRRPAHLLPGPAGAGHPPAAPAGRTGRSSSRCSRPARRRRGSTGSTTRTGRWRPIPRPPPATRWRRPATTTIWLIVSTTYPPTEAACRGLLDALIGLTAPDAAAAPRSSRPRRARRAVPLRARLGRLRQAVIGAARPPQPRPLDASSSAPRGTPRRR